jgi:Trypsin/ell wall binding domain 2 (CWB2)
MHYLAAMNKALLCLVAFVAAMTIPNIGAAAEPVAPPDTEIVGGLPAVSPANTSVPRIVTTSGGICSGTFISAEWVLTAAHCIEPRATIYTGSLSVAGLVSAGGATGHAHPSFMFFGTSIRYDFGLYRLDTASPLATPVRLAAYDEIWSSQPGTTATSFGWGLTSAPPGGSVSPDLLTGTMSIIDDVACADLDHPLGVDFDLTTAVCTSAVGVSSCNGDSGGPLFATKDGVTVQVGVTSYGPTSCNGHSVAQWVPSALTWIRSTTGLPIGGPAAPAAPQRKMRLFGLDRYDTAAAVGAYWEKSAVVFVATGQNFPDSLAAGAAAARMNAPVLLVTQNSLPLASRLLLQRLNPTNIYVAGGPAAVSDAVLLEMQAVTGAAVARMGGADRYVTAELLTRLAFPTPVSTRVWIASGRDFKDPLIASAAAAVFDEPFVLIDGQAPALSAANLALISSLGATGFGVVGPTGSFSPAVLAQLATLGPVTLYDNPDTSLRSVSVWAGLGSAVSVSFATSANFPDALAAVPWAGFPPISPVFLVPGMCIPSAVTAEVARLVPVEIVFFGGPAALSIASEALPAC